MRPYPIPPFVPSKRRCMFKMPNMAYNCRRVAHYEHSGRLYCASHYDIAWKRDNPEQGQSHLWHYHVNRFTGKPDVYETCRKCGSIRQREGLPFTPCDGKMPTIELR